MPWDISLMGTQYEGPQFGLALGKGEGVAKPKENE